ncbi:MAG TPA: hypothetical protein ENG63_04195 [Candidatus Desulfofervidus auxilii]|uniref:Uncharacterized protein n=1 Tax=Desulfofervidus auxilii TaxID=1621989 RepID=A0A7C0Y2J4_DESA2|nr:hypothetical protein [Candidatus Desulfofervidus auxilii]
MKEKIGFFDIDGVVADTGTAMIEIVQKELDKPWVKIEDITEYEITRLSWLNEFEIEFLLTKFTQPDFYINIPPMPDAAKVTEILSKAGWKIIFVTARPPYLRELTFYWLKNNDFYFDQLIVTNPQEKINYCVNSHKCFFVEDRPDVITKIAMEMPKMKIFVYDQPWNRYVKVGKRIKRLKEILEVMNKL